MSASVLEYREVRHVDDAHALARGRPAQHGRRFDDCEGGFGMVKGCVEGAAKRRRISRASTLHSTR